MKSFTAVLIIIFVAFFVLTAGKNDEKELAIRHDEPGSKMSQQSTAPAYNQFTFGSVDRNHTVSYSIFPYEKNVALKSNLRDKLSSTLLKERNSCEVLVSGGFYDTDNTHLGLFMTEGVVFESLSGNNYLINAVVLKNDSSPITMINLNEYKPANHEFAIQTGPKLISNGLDVNLKLRSDPNARRIIMFTTDDDRYGFSVIYDQTSVFQGPKLSELAVILRAIERRERIVITDAVNLDGGTASSYLSSDVKVREIQPIGSYFCVN